MLTQVIGDLNNDGHVEIAVGSRGDSDGGLQTGAVYILFLETITSVQNAQTVVTGE